MSNPNKDVIDVLNDLIEYSKDGQKGFLKSAEDVKNQYLKGFLTERASLMADRLEALVREARPLMVAPATAETIEPETALTAAYEDAYQRYRRLYPAIRAAH